MTKQCNPKEHDFDNKEPYQEATCLKCGYRKYGKDQATLKWYEANTGNHQGLIIDENNGDNIAVTYKKEDAARIVQAVNSYDGLIKLIEKIVEVNNRNGILSFGIIEECEQALLHAKGGE